MTASLVAGAITAAIMYVLFRIVIAELQYGDMHHDR